MALPTLKATELLKRGYFPRELPPPFTTRSFAKWAKTNTPSSTDTALSVSHNLARAGGLRWRLSIPNPLCHAILCADLEKHWSLLTKVIYPARLAASRPRITTTLERAVVPRYKQTELPKLRALKRLGARYHLRTDIAQFYHSIYTHAVPWALHTKAVAKANKNKTQGDQIDRAYNSRDRRSVSRSVPMRRS